MEKHPFAKITFKNCNLEYGYTICPWVDVADQLQAVESNFEGTDESDTRSRPQVVIDLVFLTEDEFSEEMKNWEV